VVHGGRDEEQECPCGDIAAGLPWLEQLIDLLPRLCLVVAMGDIAHRAFALYLLRAEARLIPWLAVAHPSGRVRNAQRELWDDVVLAFNKGAVVANADGP
jgi:uracil-DNA glycosylase